MLTVLVLVLVLWCVCVCVYICTCMGMPHAHACAYECMYACAFSCVQGLGLVDGETARLKLGGDDVVRSLPHAPPLSNPPCTYTSRRGHVPCARGRLGGAP